MEQWKLPELRQSVGYQLQVPGGKPFQQSTGSSLTPIPTSTPSPSGADRNANDSCLTSFGSSHLDRHATIKKKYRIVKSRYQARLDQHERKNRNLTTRLEELKQCAKYVVALHELQKKVTAAESYGKGLETEIRIWERTVDLYDLETPPGFGEGGLGDEEEEDSEDESEEDKDGEQEGEGESEEEEVDAMENSESHSDKDSVEEEDSESNCADDEDDY